MLNEINSVRREGTPIFVTGDFNEPSSLDWTEAVEQAGKCPVAVRWPTTAAILDAGFVDAYRVAHPDPLSSPGYTWTPITAVDDPQDRHDRIDFVLVGGSGAKVEAADVVGEKPERADVVVTPYPSDHRGVVAESTDCGTRVAGVERQRAPRFMTTRPRPHLDPADHRPLERGIEVDPPAGGLRFAGRDT